MALMGMRTWLTCCARTSAVTPSAMIPVSHVTIFRNHGLGAGTSLEHLHSQLIATPVISNEVRQRLHEALRHYDDLAITCSARKSSWNLRQRQRELG
jgi:galactose-1-phosphate uridylyltransferase